MFQRLHGHGRFEGGGVGFASVQQIVSREGGRIWAESVEGAGATFFFTLGPQTL
jgi:signal transduction histidine kinase